MAYFRKLPSGKHRAEVEIDGVRKSQSFDSKAEARDWARKEEQAIKASTDGRFPAKTFAQALERYRDEVSSQKPGKLWEERRIAALMRDFPALCAKQFAKIDAPDMAEWRDTRLGSVTKGTVLREINLLSNVFLNGAHEWKWRAGTPFTGVRKPGDNPPRTRRTHWREVKAICRWLGYRTGKVRTKQQEVAFAYLLALRTALRSQEILQLGDDCVNYAVRTATIGTHKTGHATGEPKVVPLLRPAMRLLGYVKGRGRYFTVTPASRDALYRKARKALLIEDLTFHDAKAEILTQLSRKVDVLTLSKISGNKDLQMLRDRYYRETAAEVAKRLWEPVRST